MTQATEITKKISFFLSHSSLKKSSEIDPLSYILASLTELDVANTDRFFRWKSFIQISSRGEKKTIRLLFFLLNFDKRREFLHFFNKKLLNR